MSAREHYDRLAAGYDALWSEAQAGVPEVAAAIAAALDLQPRHRLVDLGGGTGLYARALRDLAGLEPPVLVVDPSAPMLERAGGLATLRATAEAFAADAGGPPADRVLVKEAIHHVAPERRAATLAGLAGRLAPDGRLLVLMLPRAISYPLFAAARERFAALQPDPAEVAADLRAAGLEVTVERRAFGVRVARERWLALVAARHMSVLSTFSDAELHAGLAEIERATAGREMLRFDDVFCFVGGRRG